MLDPIETRYFRKFFTQLFACGQRSGRLRQFEYFEEGYLAPIDGTGHFSSGKIDCPECCVKKPGSKNPQYYHQLLACCLVKPDKKEVLPLMPDAIIQQAKKSKKALWHAIRGLFDWFLIDNWEDLFTAIIEGRCASLKQLVVDTT